MYSRIILSFLSCFNVNRLDYFFFIQKYYLIFLNFYRARDSNLDLSLYTQEPDFCICLTSSSLRDPRTSMTVSLRKQESLQSRGTQHALLKPVIRVAYFSSLSFSFSFICTILLFAFVSLHLRFLTRFTYRQACEELSFFAPTL